MTNLSTDSNASNTDISVPVSRLQKSIIYILYVIISIGAIFYSGIEDKTFLGDVMVDGFTSQVQYIWNYWNGGNSLIDLDPLLWIHVVRALIAYMFVSVEEAGGGGAVSLVLILLTIPILNIFIRLRRSYIALIIPVAMTVVSFRTFLVMLSAAYVILFIKSGRSFFLLTVSFAFSNLSSGAVMNNLIVSSTLARNHRPKSIGLIIFIISLVISFLVSALDKYQGFSEQRPGYDSTVYGASGFQAILSRSTLYVSAVDGNYTRLAAYSVLGVIGLGLFVFALKKERYRGYAAVLLSVIPSLIFEGLGFMSLFVPILLFVAGERLPWRPERIEDERND